MHRIAFCAAALLLAVSATSAEARAKFRSSGSSSAAAKPAPAAPKSDSSVLPAVAVGAAIGSTRPARARNDNPAGTTPLAAMPDGGPRPAASRPAAAPARQPDPKPAFVCATKTVGGGSGFCEMN